MTRAESGSRPGYFIMRWSWYGSLVAVAGLFGSAGYVLFKLLSGQVEGPSYVGASLGFLMFVSAGSYLVHRATGIAMADSAHLQSSALSVSTPKWTGTVLAHDVKRVRQVHSNPYNAREWPVRRWRHWIRLDFEARGNRGIRTLYVWRQEPVEFLRTLEKAGFAVEGKILEP